MGKKLSREQARKPAKRKKSTPRPKPRPKAKRKSAIGGSLDSLGGQGLDFADDVGGTRGSVSETIAPNAVTPGEDRAPSSGDRSGPAGSSSRNRSRKRPASPPPPPTQRAPADAPAAEPKPAPDKSEEKRRESTTALRLHKQALAAAQRGDCAEVRRLGQKIRALDSAYYDRTFLSDKRLAACRTAK
jgi:hypothetical protein